MLVEKYQCDAMRCTKKEIEFVSEFVFPFVVDSNSDEGEVREDFLRKRDKLGIGVWMSRQLIRDILYAITFIGFTKRV